jgi:biotin carboxylase
VHLSWIADRTTTGRSTVQDTWGRGVEADEEAVPPLDTEDTGATLAGLVDNSDENGPRLVVAYGYRSLDAMQLREAARGLCQLIWLIDEHDEAAAAIAPLLARSGPVVKALGHSAEAAARALRPHAPDGLITFYDSGMEHVAAIAAELGLPFNGLQTARRLEDKYHQRQALRSAGLPTPPVVSLPAAADPQRLRTLTADVSYPAILKPRRASGSYHTFPVHDAGELTGLLGRLAHEPAEEMILEGLIPDGPALDGFAADYVSVETLACDGNFTHLAITGRLPLVEPLRETGFFIPSTLRGKSQQAALSVATEALRALGLEWGCAHTELKLTADGPRVIEINGRVGGGVQEMLRLTTGVDVIRQSMRVALALEPEVAPMPATSGVAYRFFYQPPASARRLLSLEGIQTVAGLPGVESVLMHHNPGAELDSAHGTRTYLFAVVGHTADHAGVAAIHKRMNQAVVAHYE